MVSCNGVVSKGYEGKEPKYSIGKLDTAKVKRYPVTAAPYIFETACFVGTREILDGAMV
jgi:hypothetical protein